MLDGLVVKEDTDSHNHAWDFLVERQISTARPFEVLGTDLMDLHGQHILVSIDYYSGCILFDGVNSETAQEVIKTLNNNFKKFWSAEWILTDNGPCFRSTDIKHSTSSPHYHQSNGRVGRAVQTVKQMMRKCTSEVGTNTCSVGISWYVDQWYSSESRGTHVQPKNLHRASPKSSIVNARWQPKISTRSEASCLS